MSNNTTLPTPSQPTSSSDFSSPAANCDSSITATCDPARSQLAGLEKVYPSRQETGQPAKQQKSLGSITELRSADDYYPDTPLCRRVELQHAAQELLPRDSRVQCCMKRRVNKEEPVSLVYHPDEEKASYTNLMVCGNKWLCPVCAAHQSEKARAELQHAIDLWTAQGKHVVMATFTLRHRNNELCRDVMNGLLDSFSAFWRCRAGQKIVHDHKIIGRVRGLEPTVGDNGWHPHIHCLLFLDREFIRPGEIFDLQNQCRELWQHVLKRHGRDANTEYGVKITINEAVLADYVSKFGIDDGKKHVRYSQEWTEASEATKGHVKVSGHGGRTPNGLLNDYSFGDERAGKLWLEYAEAFKGKSILHWSPGLKDHLGLDDYIKSLPQKPEPTEEKVIIAQFPLSVWKKILHYSIAPHLLDIGGTGEQEMIRWFLAEHGISTSEVIWPTIPDLPPSRAGP